MGGRGAAMALALIVAAAGAGAAGADPARLVGTGDAARWRAVASLDVGGARGCTAVLISDHEALTAAHCVVDRATGTRRAAAAMQLVLGQTAAGRAATRGVRAVAFLPAYLTDPQVGAAGLSADVALLDLDSPVSAAEAVPLRVAEWSDPVGAFVDIVGYERGGPPGATIRDGCTATDSAGGVTAVTCDVISGLSGAPVVLSGDPAKPPVLVAVVSSRSTTPGLALAFVVTVAPQLAALRALIGP